MVVHSDKSSRSLWRRRSRRRGPAAGHSREHPSIATSPVAAAQDRRKGGRPQDQALYSCGCGLKFEALVSTSVDCPRCGTTQAW